MAAKTSLGCTCQTCALWAQRSTSRPKRKTCGKCGRRGYYQPAGQRCRFHTFGPTSYWCNGVLSAITRTRRVKLPPGVGLGYVMTDEFLKEQRAAAVLRYRKRIVAARGRLVERRNGLADTVKFVKGTLAAAVTKLTRAEKAVARAEKKANMTDTEITAMQERAATARQVAACRARLTGKRRKA